MIKPYLSTPSEIFHKSIKGDKKPLKKCFCKQKYVKCLYFPKIIYLINYNNFSFLINFNIFKVSQILNENTY